jgi:hypothetical protein
MRPKNTPGAKTIQRKKLNGSESRERHWQEGFWTNKARGQKTDEVVLSWHDDFSLCR